jgi:hypothetical protein
MTNQLFPFELSDEDSLIQIDFWFQKDKLTFAVDTGASHTVIDLAPLLIAGYELKDALGMVELETGKGVIEAYIFRIPRITALGITRNNFEICSYDFFNNNVFSTFDGVLGLDFLRDNKICIDFRESLITMS